MLSDSELLLSNFAGTSGETLSDSDDSLIYFLVCFCGLLRTGTSSEDEDSSSYLVLDAGYLAYLVACFGFCVSADSFL